MASFANFDMTEFLKKDVDLWAYFSAQEYEAMCDAAKLRYKNMALNYEMMRQMGLPAIKPNFMLGPAHRARCQRIIEEQADNPPSSSDSETDDEWTPHNRGEKNTETAAFKFDDPKILSFGKGLMHFVRYHEWTPQNRGEKNTETGSKRKAYEAPIPTTEKKIKKATKKRVTKAELTKQIRTYDLRERPEVNFMNLEPPDEDHFLYCEECNKEYDMDCPVHGPLDYIEDKQVLMMNDPNRALHTLPDGFVVKESSIVGAGLGVFTEKEIPPRTKFGPYGGVRVTDQTKAHKSGYCWQVHENGKPSHFVDAQDKTTSNWMRYVNCAVSETDQNLVAFQHKGAIYYRSYRPILPGQELLVWYGDEYARELGLVRDKNLLFRPSYVNGEVYFPCVFCKIAFSAAYYCVKHLMRVHGRDKLKAEDIQVLDTWLRQNGHDRYSKGSKHERSNKTYSCDNSGGAGEKSVTIQERCADGKPYKCDVCGYASNWKHHLIRHKRAHTGEKPYKCDVCGYTCSDKYAFITHKRIHTGEKLYKCDVCGYAFSQKHHLITHKRTHTGEKPYKCDVCGYTSNQKSHLIIHKRKHTAEKPYKCDVCGYAFSQKPHLIRHKRTHTGEKPYTCDVCGYAFSQKPHLITHKRIHTGEKLYKCDVCGYACYQIGNLITHKRTHTGEKPYKCDVCGYACNREDVLITHKRTHTGEKPYKCDVCGYAFSDKSNLITHKRTHTGEKPYKCDVCGYTCSDGSTYRKHKQRHTGEKPYKCDVCGYACSDKRNLITHKRIHTGKKPYKCDVCGYACSDGSTYRKHKQRHTGEKPN